MVRQAWKKTALRLHPDKNQGDPTAEERFKRAKEAYEVPPPPSLCAPKPNPAAPRLKVARAVVTCPNVMRRYCLIPRNGRSMIDTGRRV
jgi:hypothetical protein